MKHSIKTLFFSSLVTCFVATSALAQTAACGKRDQVIEKLQSKYGETRQTVGLGNNNRIIEMWASSFD